MEYFKKFMIIIKDSQLMPPRISLDYINYLYVNNRDS